MNPWLYVVTGGFFEMVWATAMMKSDGFSILPWTIVTMVFCMVSVYFLYQGMKSIPAGACYAVWTGCGTVLSTVSGVILFGDVLSGIEVLFLAILIGGILLLQYFDGSGKNAGS